MEQNDLQRALMAVLFAAGEPVASSRLAESLQVDESEIHRECEALISAAQAAWTSAGSAGMDSARREAATGSPAAKSTARMARCKSVCSMDSSLSGADRLVRVLEVGDGRVGFIVDGNGLEFT